MKNNSNYQNENTNAICSLDFSTAFDAYNYAMAHRLDTNPLAVAIKSDARGTDFLHSLAMNGVKLYGIWCDFLDDTATEYIYTTEAGARELKAGGMSNVAIAKELGVSEGTVRYYLKNG